MTTIFFCIGHRLLFQLGHFELDYVSNCYMKYDSCHAIHFKNYSSQAYITIGESQTWEN